jgi:GAF domain-containing protein
VGPDRLARVAGVLGDVSGPPVLDRLVVLCVDMLSVTGAGVAVIGNGQHRGAVAVSDRAYGMVDDLQFSLGEGPCIAADRSARPVLEPELALAAGQWPAFVPAALDLGVRAAFAFPLRMGGIQVGVLNLYRDTPGDLDGTDLGDALALAHIATHLLLELESDLLPGMLPERLAEIVDHRAHVHQATGMIAAQLDVDVAMALSRLRAFAWARDRSIDDVASDVVARMLRFDEDEEAS